MDPDPRCRDQRRRHQASEQHRQPGDSPQECVCLILREPGDARQEDDRHRVGHVEDQLGHRHGHAVQTQGTLGRQHDRLNDVGVDSVVEVAGDAGGIQAKTVAREASKGDRLAARLPPGQTSHGNDVNQRQQPGDGDARSDGARNSEAEDGDQERRERQRDHALADQDGAVGPHLLAAVQDGHAESRHEGGRNDDQDGVQQVVGSRPQHVSLQPRQRNPDQRDQDRREDRGEEYAGAQQTADRGAPRAEVVDGVGQAEDADGAEETRQGGHGHIGAFAVGAQNARDDDRRRERQREGDDLRREDRGDPPCEDAPPFSRGAHRTSPPFRARRRTRSR